MVEITLSLKNDNLSSNFTCTTYYLTSSKLIIAANTYEHLISEICSSSSFTFCNCHNPIKQAPSCSSVYR